MAKTKENRTRSVQVKFRLTPEEKSVLDQDVKNSGLTMSDYLIRTLINRIGVSAINCERKYCGGSVDISFKIGGQRIGYASCLFFQNIRKVQISGFYVVKSFQDMGIEEKLMEEIYEYADLNGAESIIAYPGPEPYCPTEWKPMDAQTAWYEAQGFQIDHMVNGVVPCMIKDLTHEVAL